MFFVGEVNSENIAGIILQFLHVRQLFLAHGQVDKCEDVVLNHDGEAEEDGVHHQHIDTQL